MSNYYSFKPISPLAYTLVALLLFLATAHSQTVHFSTSFARTQTVSNGRTNEFRDIKTDADGNTYILTFLSHSQVFNGQTYSPGHLLIKYNSSEQVQWALQETEKNGVTILFDALENPIVVGSQTVTTSQGWIESRLSITKYDPSDGSILWNNVATAGNGTTVEGAAISPDGHIYIAFTKSNSYYVGWGAINNFGFNSGGDRQAIIKTDTNGNGLWAKFVTSDATWNIEGSIYGISAGDDNEVYIVGKGVRLFPEAGSRGTFVSRMNSDGTLSWFKRMSTSTDHSATGVIYHEGHIYVCGDVANQAYTSLDFGNGINAATLDFQKGYVAKLAPNGTARWLVTNTTGTKAGIGNGLRFVKLTALPNGNILALANLKSKDIVFGGKTINSDYLYQGWLAATGDNTMVFELDTAGLLISSFTTSDGLSKAQILSAAPDNTVWFGGTYSSHYSASSLFKIGSNTHAHTGGVNDYNFFIARVTPEAVPLPVTLIKFEAKTEQSSAKLSWETASESNNKEFIIYRSGDDKVFKQIGTIVGAGNSATKNSYSHLDKNPLSGTNYYKLAQVDFDGKTTVLDIKSLSFGILAQSLKIYPNPVTDKITVHFDRGKYHTLSLAGIDGKVLQTVGLKPDQENIEIDLTAYAKGIYLVKLISDAQTDVQKVIKL